MDALTTNQPLTLGAIALAAQVANGASEGDYNAALAELSTDLGFAIPLGWSYANFSDAGDAPSDPSNPTSNPAFVAWFASLG